MRVAHKRSLSSLLRERDNIAEDQRRKREKEEKDETNRLIEREEAQLPPIPTQGVDDTVRALEALIMAAPTTNHRSVEVTFDMRCDETPAEYMKVTELANDPWWDSIRAWSAERSRFIDNAMYDHLDAAAEQDKKVEQLLNDAWTRARMEEDQDGLSTFTWNNGELKITVFV